MSDVDLRALSATMRPVDALTGAGLGHLVPLVAPLQGVLDRMAGNAQLVGDFITAWTGVADRADRVQRQLGEAVAKDTGQWRGAAADAYRARASGFGASLGGFRHAVRTAVAAADHGATAVAHGRSAAYDLVADLVRRLTSLAHQSMAIEGGMTATALAQAGDLVRSYSGPVAAVERQVRDSVEQATRSLASPTAKLEELVRSWGGQSGVDTTAEAGDARGIQRVADRDPDADQIIPHDRPEPPTDTPEVPGGQWRASKHGWLPMGSDNSPHAIFERVPPAEQQRYVDWLRTMTAAGVSPQLSSMALSFTPGGAALPVVSADSGVGLVAVPEGTNPAQPVVGREVVKVEGGQMGIVHGIADSMKAAADRLGALDTDRRELWIQIPPEVLSFNALRDHVLPHLNDIMVNLPQDQYDRIQRLQVGFFYPDGQLIGSVRHEDQDTLDSLRPRPPLKNEADFSARDRLRDL